MENILDITGIIHVGADQGQEIEMYIDAGITNIMLFEPSSENFDILEKNVSELNADIQGYQVKLGNETKNIIMNDEEVEMKRLDDYDTEGYNFISVNINEYDIEILKGSEKTLEKIDYVYFQVEKEPDEQDNLLIEEIDQYLSKYNLNRVEKSWWGDVDSGDLFYIKNH